MKRGAKYKHVKCLLHTTLAPKSNQLRTPSPPDDDQVSLTSTDLVVVCAPVRTGAQLIVIFMNTLFFLLLYYSTNIPFSDTALILNTSAQVGRSSASLATNVSQLERLMNLVMIGKAQTRNENLKASESQWRRGEEGDGANLEPGSIAGPLNEARDVAGNLYGQEDFDRASEHLRKLLARPRSILSTFVPHTLTRQLVLKRPNHSNLLTKRLKRLHEKLYNTKSGLRGVDSFNHISQPPSQAMNLIDENQKSIPTPKFSMPQIQSSSSLLRLQPSLPIAPTGTKKQANLFALPQDRPQAMRPLLVPANANSVAAHLGHQPRNQQQSGTQMRPLAPNNGEQKVVLIHNMPQAPAPLPPPIRLPPFVLDSTESEGGDSSGKNSAHLNDEETERGLVQIDQLIKHEYENRLNFNDRLIEPDSTGRLQTFGRPTSVTNGHNKLMVTMSPVRTTTIKPGGELEEYATASGGLMTTTDRPMMLSTSASIPLVTQLASGEQQDEGEDDESVVALTESSYPEGESSPVQVPPDSALNRTMERSQQILDGSRISGEKSGLPGAGDTDKRGNLLPKNDFMWRTSFYRPPVMTVNVRKLEAPTRFSVPPGRFSDFPASQKGHSFVPTAPETIAQLRLNNNNNISTNMTMIGNNNLGSKENLMATDNNNKASLSSSLPHVQQQQQQKQQQQKQEIQRRVVGNPGPYVSAVERMIQPESTNGHQSLTSFHTSPLPAAYATAGQQQQFDLSPPNLPAHQLLQQQQQPPSTDTAHLTPIPMLAQYEPADSSRRHPEQSANQAALTRISGAQNHDQIIQPLTNSMLAGLLASHQASERLLGQSRKAAAQAAQRQIVLQLHNQQQSGAVQQQAANSEGQQEENDDSAPNVLSETLRRLRETKAKIKQLQAELNATDPASLLLLTGPPAMAGALAAAVAASNRSSPSSFPSFSLSTLTSENLNLNGHLQQKSSDEMRKPSSGDDDILSGMMSLPIHTNTSALATAGQLQDQSRHHHQVLAGGPGEQPYESMFRFWPLGNGSIFVRATGGSLVQARDSLNLPIGMFHTGPLTAPARLMASAFGRTAQNVLAFQPAAEQSGWPAIRLPAGSLGPPAHPSSAPILLASTMTVEAEPGSRLTSARPELASPQHQHHLTSRRPYSWPLGTIREPPAEKNVSVSEVIVGAKSGTESSFGGALPPSRLGGSSLLAGAHLKGGQGSGSHFQPSGPLANSATANNGNSNNNWPTHTMANGSHATQADVALVSQRPAAASESFHPSADSGKNHWLQLSSAGAANPASDSNASLIQSHHRHRHQLVDTREEKWNGKLFEQPTGGQTLSAPPAVAPVTEPAPAMSDLWPRQRPSGAAGQPERELDSLGRPATARKSSNLLTLVGGNSGKRNGNQDKSGARRQPGGDSFDSDSVNSINSIIGGAGSSGNSASGGKDGTGGRSSDRRNAGVGESNYEPHQQAGNFISRLFGRLFSGSGGKSNYASTATNQAASSASEQQHGGGLISRLPAAGDSGGSSAQNLTGAQFDPSAADSTSKLTTEKVLHALIYFFCSLALVCLVIIFATLRLKQTRQEKKTSNSNFAASSPAAFPGPQLDWRRFALGCPAGKQANGNQVRFHRDNLLLDGTMHNVSLLPSRQTAAAATAGKSNQQVAAPGASSTSNEAGSTGLNLPVPMMNRSCCHCVTCSESWLFRSDSGADSSAPPALCSSGFYHPAPRGKLPFGAASSVNKFLSQFNSRRQSATTAQSDSSAQLVLSPGDASEPNKSHLRHQALCTRGPIGGTRLRMMSAIDERTSPSFAALPMSNCCPLEGDTQPAAAGRETRPANEDGGPGENQEAQCTCANRICELASQLDGHKEKVCQFHFRQHHDEGDFLISNHCRHLHQHQLDAEQPQEGNKSCGQIAHAHKHCHECGADDEQLSRAGTTSMGSPALGQHNNECQCDKDINLDNSLANSRCGDGGTETADAERDSALPRCDEDEEEEEDEHADNAGGPLAAPVKRPVHFSNALAGQANRGRELNSIKLHAGSSNGAQVSFALGNKSSQEQVIVSAKNTVNCESSACSGCDKHCRAAANSAFRRLPGAGRQVSRGGQEALEGQQQRQEEDEVKERVDTTSAKVVWSLSNPSGVFKASNEPKAPEHNGPAGLRRTAKQAAAAAVDGKHKSLQQSGQRAKVNGQEQRPQQRQQLPSCAQIDEYQEQCSEIGHQDDQVTETDEKVELADSGCCSHEGPTEYRGQQEQQQEEQRAKRASKLSILTAAPFSLAATIQRKLRRTIIDASENHHHHRNHHQPEQKQKQQQQQHQQHLQQQGSPSAVRLSPMKIKRQQQQLLHHKL